MQKYEIILYWSNDDRVFIAKCQNYPDALPMAILRKQL